MMNRVRLYVALSLAPLVAIPGMCVGALLRGHGAQFGAAELLAMSALYLPFAYVTALLIGLPLHLWLRRSSRNTWWMYALAGAAITLVVSVIPIPGTFATAGDRVAMGLTGVLAGLAFRAIVGAGSGVAPGSPATSSSAPRGSPSRTR